MISASELQPFLDLLKSRGLLTHEMSAEEQAEALRYFVNVKHVTHLLRFEPADVSMEELICAVCGNNTPSSPHREGCSVMGAWQALDHFRGHEAVGAAWDRGARASPWAQQRGAPAARRTGGGHVHDFVRENPNTMRCATCGVRDYVPEQPASRCLATVVVEAEPANFNEFRCALFVGHRGDCEPDPREIEARRAARRVVHQVGREPGTAYCGQPMRETLAGSIVNCRNCREALGLPPLAG